MVCDGSGEGLRRGWWCFNGSMDVTIVLKPGVRVLPEGASNRRYDPQAKYNTAQKTFLEESFKSAGGKPNPRATEEHMKNHPSFDDRPDLWLTARTIRNLMGAKKSALKKPRSKYDHTSLEDLKDLVASRGLVAGRKKEPGLRSLLIAADEEDLIAALDASIETFDGLGIDQLVEMCKERGVKLPTQPYTAIALRSVLANADESTPVTLDLVTVATAPRIE